MPQVVARFYVSSLEKKAGDTATVHMTAVSSKENARWSTYTPSGSVQMELTRKASGARTAFEGLIGKECLVTFDFDAPKGEAPDYVNGEGYVSDEVVTPA